MKRIAPCSSRVRQDLGLSHFDPAGIMVCLSTSRFAQGSNRLVSVSRASCALGTYARRFGSSDGPEGE
jgi:hypothetical protein